MKTADEMMKYIEDNGFRRSSYSKYMLKKRAQYIEEQLGENEYVMMCFVAQIASEDNNRSFPSILFTPISFAYRDICFVALTNKRIIQSNIRNLFIHEKSIIVIELTYLNDISKHKKLFATTMVIDTINERLSYIMFNRYGSITYKNFQTELAKIRDKKNSKELLEENKNIMEEESSFEKAEKKDPKFAMSQVKELYEAGLITEEKYNNKISEILNKI